MKYIIEIHVGYCERSFMFDNLEDAGKFAETILTHQMVANDDRQTSVEIRMEADND